MDECPTRIGVPKVTYASLSHVTTDDDYPGDPNWGEYEEIARFDGKPVKMGYDYHSLNHCVLIGDEVVVNDIPLLYETHDTSFYDLVENKAGNDYIRQESTFTLTPAPPEFIFPLMEGSNNAISMDYVWESPQYLTASVTDNATYPAGGGRSSETIYYTIDKKSGRILTEKDLVKTKDRDKFVDAVINAVYEDLVSPEGEHYYSMDELNECLSEYYNSENEFNIALVEDRLIVGYAGDYITNFGEDGNWNVVLPLSILKR